MIKIVQPSPSWQEGMILFMMAFSFLPDDFETWDIRVWDNMCKLADTKIKSDANRTL